MAVRHIKTEEEWKALLAEGKIVIVDFTATWCGPCRAIAPVYSSLAEQYLAKKANVVFAKVDVDECAALAKACGVSCMPTFQVYVNGKKVGGMEGANKEKLEKLAAKYAAAA